MQEAAKEIQRASAEAGAAAPPGVTRVQVEAAPISASDLLWRSGGGALLFGGQALAVIVLVFYFLASVWGSGAGLLNVIPYVGPAAFTVGASLAAFLHFGTVTHAAIIGAASTVIGTVEGFFITPLIMGRAGGTNGLAEFLSLTLWRFLWAFWGMLLAVPLTMAMKVLAEHLEELNGLGEFLRE